MEENVFYTLVCPMLVWSELREVDYISFGIITL
jgi:hypothetical protein